ncbi:MAG: peptide chain release factor 2 [Lentisphaeria bacterium]|nr:peptide chain release factor 2 [Candidatus Neomarinimicrobiota bacterium]MCF7841529.1 peptide chain release factor 2 [Lentisphaeria bacterium]
MFDHDTLEAELADLKKQSLDPTIWNDPQSAQKVLQKIHLLESKVKDWENLEQKEEDCGVLLELADEEGDDSFGDDIRQAVAAFQSALDDYELRQMLSAEDDPLDAILSIHPGAGGTESQDWALMLFRMYTRYFENRGFDYKVLDFQPGDEAGIKDATIEVKGSFAYGYLKAENGIHRLVRISPFDANSRRHTSFASVFVYPLFDNEIEITIDPSDLRIDTYRASGAGGQHVNKTDSAIRITHEPTGIVVQCQNERSQFKNREVAMKMLKNRLYQLEREKELAKKQEREDSKSDIAWGNQIRSYVFQPYTMVKDHRTKEETGNIQAVMDGAIDPFIKAFLLSQMGKTSE